MREGYPVNGDNPSAGRRAYVAAAMPADYLPDPCQHRRTVCCGNDPDPVDPEPETPPCLQVAYATDINEPLQEFTYSLDTETYTASDGSTGAYATNTGWVLTTLFDTYNPVDVTSLSPVGVFCSSDGDLIALVPCDKYEAPPVDPITCIELVFVTDNATSPGQYTQTIIGYTSVTSAGIVNYQNSRWEFTLGADLLINDNDDPDNPYGLYVSQTTGACAVFKECSDEDPPELPECVETVFTDDEGDPLAVPPIDPYMLGQFTLTGSVYTPDDPLQGTLAFSPTTGWTITDPNSVVFTGGNDPYNPIGVYTAVNGECILLKEC